MRILDVKSKVVVRKLPPTLTESNFLEAIVKDFQGTYNWFSYYPGNTKRGVCSRAYLNFKNAQDVQQFSDGFQGHVFVNERGMPFPAQIEYAPYQRIPKQRSRQDAREGTIEKDEDYLSFVATLEHPVENLPSAEIQLERKEAEKSAKSGEKGNVTSTPLMEYVRQKRALRAASIASAHKQTNSSSKSGGRKVEGKSVNDNTKGGEGGKGGGVGGNGSVSRRQKQLAAAAMKKKVHPRTPTSVTGKNSSRAVGASGVLSLPADQKADKASPSSILPTPSTSALPSDLSTSNQKIQTVVSTKFQHPGTSRGAKVEPLPGIPQVKLLSRPKPTERREGLNEVASSGSGTSGAADVSAENSAAQLKLRNKHRPDRPVWTPKRRGDEADPGGAVSVSGKDNAIGTQSVANKGLLQTQNQATTGFTPLGAAGQRMPAHGQTPSQRGGAQALGPVSSPGLTSQVNRPALLQRPKQSQQHYSGSKGSQLLASGVERGVDGGRGLQERNSGDLRGGRGGRRGGRGRGSGGRVVQVGVGEQKVFNPEEVKLLDLSNGS